MNDLIPFDNPLGYVHKTPNHDTEDNPCDDLEYALAWCSWRVASDDAETCRSARFALLGAFLHKNLDPYEVVSGDRVETMSCKTEGGLIRFLVNLDIPDHSFSFPFFVKESVWDEGYINQAIALNSTLQKREPPKPAGRRLGNAVQQPAFKAVRITPLHRPEYQAVLDALDQVRDNAGLRSFLASAPYQQLTDAEFVQLVHSLPGRTTTV